jgi:hypothetical protein
MGRKIYYKVEYGMYILVVLALLYEVTVSKTEVRFNLLVYIICILETVYILCPIYICRVGFKYERPGFTLSGPPQSRNGLHRYHRDNCFSNITKM